MPDDPEKKQDLAPALVWDDPEVELRGRHMRGSDMWLEDPAMATLTALAGRRLSRVAEQRGGLATQVKGIRAALLPGTKLLYIRPVSAGERANITVTWDGWSASFNLRTLLEPKDLCALPGMRYRFAVEFAGPNSPAGPALVVDLGNPVETKDVPIKIKKKAKRCTT